MGKREKEKKRSAESCEAGMKTTSSVWRGLRSGAALPKRSSSGSRPNRGSALAGQSECFTGRTGLRTGGGGGGGRFALQAAKMGTVCLFGLGGGGKPAQAKMGEWPPEDNTFPFATFAAGCFWGVELRFQRVPGVVKTAVGYIQGEVDNPTYEMICTGMTGHTEAVQMTYDPSVVTFEELCDVFYGGHNPKQLNQQGNDVGTQYRSGIYYHNEEQKKIAKEKKGKVDGAVTEIQEAAKFWPAEVYHQQYLEKGGRFSQGQSAAKGCTDPIRCYG